MLNKLRYIKLFMKNKKNKGFKNKRIKMLAGGILFVLLVALIFVFVQNMKLRKEIKELNNQQEIIVMESINDFTKMIIEKIDTCLPVQIVSTDKSAIVLGTQCLEKI